MIQHLLVGRIASRREWLRGLGLGAGVAALPAATISEGSAFAKDNTMLDIMHLARIHASSERAYQAITTAEGIRQWWTRDAAIEPKVGAAGEFGFDGKRFVAKVTVEELHPTTRVRWKVANAACEGQDIEFNLKADGNDTIFVFAHRGFPRAEEGYASATFRWGFYLLNLKRRYMETGKGNAEPGRQRRARLRRAALKRVPVQIFGHVQSVHPQGAACRDCPMRISLWGSGAYPDGSLAGPRRGGPASG